MTSSPRLSETALAQECLQRLGEKGGILHQVQDMLELVAHSCVGLGEVLQDFARQTHSQICDLTQAARRLADGTGTPEDRETLANAYFILNTARLVLDRTPVAMQRNMAESLGSGSKLSRADVQAAAHAFQNCPDISRLLAQEDNGRKLASLIDRAADARPPQKTDAYRETAPH